MHSGLRRVLRFLARPLIRTVVWAEAQHEVLNNERLAIRLAAKDPTRVYLHGRIRINRPERCRIGIGVAIHDADWDARGGISIGDYVHFGPNVSMHTFSHNIDGQALPYDETGVAKPITIGNNVWIGRDVVIAPGTTIGDGAVVAMGAVVSGTVPPLAIVASPKYRTLRYRDADRYEALMREGKTH